MPQQVIGKCSVCGGPVSTWVGPWFSVDPPPPPKCERCGATEKQPTIPMEHPK